MQDLLCLIKYVNRYPITQTSKSLQYGKEMDMKPVFGSGTNSYLNPRLSVSRVMEISSASLYILPLHFDTKLTGAISLKMYFRSLPRLDRIRVLRAYTVGIIFAFR